MRCRGGQALVALALAVAFTTAPHTDELSLSAAGFHAPEHQHGPSGSCPDVSQHHCLACHAAGLLGPLAAPARIAPPQARRAAWKRPQRIASRSAAPHRVGRSPPVLPAV